MHSQSPRPAPSSASFLRSAEVAAILQVSPKTIVRWANKAGSPTSAPSAGTAATPSLAIRLAASLVQEVRTT